MPWLANLKCRRVVSQWVVDSPRPLGALRQSQPGGLIVFHSAVRTFALTAGLLSALRARPRQRAALAAPPADLQARDANVKSLLARYLRLQPLEQRACELLDPAALEASQMHVIDVGFRFVEVFLAVQVHEVQLIDQTQFLQQLNRPVNGRPIDVFVALPRQFQQSCGVQVAIGGLDGFDKDPALARDANASQGQFLEQRTTF